MRKSHILLSEFPPHVTSALCSLCNNNITFTAFNKEIQNELMKRGFKSDVALHLKLDSTEVVITTPYDMCLMKRVE